MLRTILRMFEYSIVDLQLAWLLGLAWLRLRSEICIGIRRNDKLVVLAHKSWSRIWKDGIR